MEKMTKGLVIGLFLCCLIFTGDALAGLDMDALEAENAKLKERVEKLESALTRIEEMLGEKKEIAMAAPAKPSDKPVVTSKYPINVYGYIKLDQSYDTDRTNAGNFARWVLSEDSVEKGDDQYNITARQSRFGLNLLGPDIADGIKTSGKVEIDFYGGGAENKNSLMLRHAYIKMDWPDNKFNIIAGQTSDVISPLVPTTINYPVAWWAGDIGYRRPQIRLTKGFDIGTDSELTLQGAITRTIGDDGPFDPGDTGEDAGFPSGQGRIALSVPLLAEKNSSFGISGHYGEEEYDYTANDDSQNVDTWSIGLDVKIPITQKLTFSGEVWTGENLDAYLGGVAQGIVVSSATDGSFISVKEIASTGGWAALAMGPFDKWRLNLGGSVDNPEDNDLSDGMRSKNSSYWGNVLFDLNESVQIGLELSHWDTEYKNMDDGDNFRVQNSFTYKF